VLAASYRYNGKGERVRKTTADEDTVTLYDDTGRWLGDYQSNGTPIQQAIWLDDLPVGLLVGAGTQQTLYYIQADALGTPRVLIDPDRDVAVWTWPLTNDAFGDSTPNQDPDNDGVQLVFDMRFPGQRYDKDTGLNDNYFRDYDTSIGRYAQSDPIGLEGGISTYAYVDENPLIGIDPEGLAGSAAVPVPRYTPPAVPNLPRAPGIMQIVPAAPGANGWAVARAAAGRAGAVGAVGWAGWELGTFINSRVGADIGRVVDNVCRDDQPDCEREWEGAYARCQQLIYEQMRQRAGRARRRSVTGVTGGYTDLYRCAAGLVSERCGGNMVD
jgi:RHS repeat-associated protein